MSSSGAVPKIIQGTPGAKGDPGGLVLGTLIGAADLDTLTADGIYRQNVGGDCTLERHYPKAGGTGTMVVRSRDAGAIVLQIFEPINGIYPRMVYRRQLVSGTWSPWQAYASTRLDNTAGRAIYQWDDTANREQRVYGDTGWRDVSAELLDGATGTLVIRRLHDTIYVKANSIMLPQTVLTNAIYSMPTAFWVDDGHFIGRENAATGDYAAFFIGGSIAFRRSIHGAANNTTHRFGFSAQGSTSAAWPTVLPGTAAGSIPNS